MQVEETARQTIQTANQTPGEETLIRLCDLAVGEVARVVAVGNTGPIRRRLLDLGLVPGAVVICVGRSPGGDPAAYRIRGAVIAIRDGDAAPVTVRRDASWTE